MICFKTRAKVRRKSRNAKRSMQKLSKTFAFMIYLKFHSGLIQETKQPKRYVVVFAYFCVITCVDSVR